MYDGMDYSSGRLIEQRHAYASTRLVGLLDGRIGWDCFGQQQQQGDDVHSTTGTVHL